MHRISLGLAILFAFAGSALAAPLPDVCKLVEVERPDLKRPEFYITFQGVGADVDSIRACNPSGFDDSSAFGVVPSPTEGTRVSLRVVGGVGKLGLPKMYAIGKAHQMVCDVDDKGEVFWRLYAVEWAELPDRIQLVDQTDSMVGVAEQFQKACEASRPPSRI